MSGQGQGFTNPTQPRPSSSRSQNSLSSYGANSNQQGGRGSGGAGRGRGDLTGRGTKRGGSYVVSGGPGPFEDQKTASADGSQGINFIAPESNGGVPAQNPAHLVSNGPPGGKLEFGSFAGLPDPIRPAGNQTQNRPGVPQPQSGALQPGLPQQQQQQRLDRRGSGPGSRNNNSYKQPNHYDPHAQPGAQPTMHYSAYNRGPPAPQSGYMQPQQQGYPYGHQANYYQGFQPVMMPAGGYPQGYNGSQQPAARTSQGQPQYRPSQPPARSQPQQQHQSAQPAAAAVPALRRKKPLDIIDPTTHSKVEISPRSAEAANSEQGSAKPTPTPSPHKDQVPVKPESKALTPVKPADKDNTKVGDVASAQAQSAPSASGSEALHTKALPKQHEAAGPAASQSASQQPQQPQQQSQAKPISSVKEHQPADAQQQPSPPASKAPQKAQTEDVAKQGSGSAAPKAEPSAPSAGAWGGARSFRDIAASKPDKAAEDKRRSDEQAKRKAEEAERKAEADRKDAANQQAEADRKAQAERQAEADQKAAADRAAAEKAAQEAEAKVKAQQQEAERKQQAKQEAEAKAQAEQLEAAANADKKRKEAEQQKKEEQKAEQERVRKEKADKAAADKAAAEAKQKAEAEAEAKVKADQEAKLKADEAAEAKRKADAEAEQKAEAEKQAEADHKAAAEQAAKAEAAKEAEAQAAAAQKQKDDDAKASKSKADEAPASPSKDSASALSTNSASSLSAKQKRKDMMKRAEEKDTAAGYEDPFQPKQATAAQSSAPAAGPQPVKTQAEPSGRSASGDAEDDDWEQTADRTPRGPTAPQPSAQASTSGRKAYTLDWMLHQQDQPECQQLPKDFDAGDLVAIGWRSDPHMGGGAGVDGPTRVPGGGRGMGAPRNMAGPRAGVIPPPGVGMGGPPDKWQQSGPPPPMMGQGMDPRGRGGPPMGMAQPGRGGGRGPVATVEGDRWGKRALPPPPPGTGGPAMSNLPALHKTDNKFKIGQVEGNNPEEIKKQKAVKGLLNKITPEKFEKILADIIAVGYETEETESGLIDQVFDKALTETTFCEIYADLCFQLNNLLPSFEPESQDGKKRTNTFRKQLLNKCQEEFEKGAAAMEAVEAREKAEQAKSKEEKEQEQAEAAEASGSESEVASSDTAERRDGQEEGEIVAPPPVVDKKTQRLQARRAAAQAAADELRARQRALGNIQFIGHLYRKKMLTEKIMHECIRKLLADVASPKQEDLECLVKLLSTVGRQLDNPNAKNHMDAYFQRVSMLSNNMSLESRIRFMLQDLIDLRWNSWVARREVEGPKTIDQVHADARRDDANRARAAAGGPRGGHRGSDYRSGGQDSYGGPPQRRMPSRHDSMIEGPVRPMQRNSSQEFTSFRPGGGAQGAPSLSLRPGGAATGAMLPRSSAAQQPSDKVAAARQAPAAEAAPAPSQAPPAAPQKLSREELDNKLRGCLEEYFSARDKTEVSETVKELQDKTEAAQIFEQIPLVAVGKMRGVDWGAITEVMVYLCSGEQALLSKQAVQAGCHALLNTMGTEDVIGDAPKAADWVGGVLGSLVGVGVLPLKEVATATLKAAVEEAGEDGQLVDGGSAWKLIGAVLQAVADRTSQKEMAHQWKGTGLELSAFFPSFERDDAAEIEQKVKNLVTVYVLPGLAPKIDIQPHIQEAITKGDSVDSMLQWVLSQRGPESIKDPDLAKQVTLAVLRHAIPSPKVRLFTATCSVSAPEDTINACMICTRITSHTDKPCSLQKHQASQTESSGTGFAQAQTHCSRA
ncbi:TPA: hypothetical protein ACH3X1_011264 [Trebouxia sp. C0004]